MLIYVLCVILNINLVVFLHLTFSQPRWLKDRLQNTFQKSGLDFNVAYITNVRNWCDSMAAFSTLAGAYKKRKDDTKEIPHSFTFARRDSAMVDSSCLVCF